MTTSILAQIIGPMTVVATISFLIQPKLYANLMKDFEKSAGAIFFGGMFSMLTGLIIVLNHNIWELSAAGLITFIGWGGIIKGVTFMLTPNILLKISKSILSSEIMMKIAMIIWLAAGGYLSYVGYFA